MTRLPIQTFQLASLLKPWSAILEMPMHIGIARKTSRRQTLCPKPYLEKATATLPQGCNESSIVAIAVFDAELAELP